MAMAIPIALMAVGTAVSAYGQYRSGQAAEAVGEQNQQIAEYNAKVAESDAAASKEKAAYDEEQTRRKYASIIGQQRAAYAKAGVDIAEGSPLLVMSQQAEDAERDALAIRYGGAVEQAQNLNRANVYRAQGAQAYYQGQQTNTASKIGAMGTIFSGAAQTTMTGMKLKKGIY